MDRNAIIERLIPAGTGMPYCQRVEVLEEVHETREETFDIANEPDFSTPGEAGVGGTYGLTRRQCSRATPVIAR